MLDDDDKLGITPEEGEDQNDSDAQERELNVNSSDELEAMDDFTFAENTGEDTASAPEDDAMAIFDEFMTADETATPTPTPAQELSLEALELSADELFSDIPENMHVEPEGLLDDTNLGYNQDNTATEILEEQAEMQEQAAEPSYAAPAADAGLFASDAFDDINSEQLFDYDPNEGADAGSSDDMFANIDTGAGDLTGDPDEAFQTKSPGIMQKLSSTGTGILFGIIGKLPAKVRDFLPVKPSASAPAMAGGGGAGGDGPSGSDAASFRRRRMLRMLSMILLVMLVYSLLRSCIGGRTDVAMQDEVLDAGDTIPAVTQFQEVTPDFTTISQLEDSSAGDADIDVDTGFDIAPSIPKISLGDEDDITPELATEIEQFTFDLEAAAEQLAIDLETAQELQNLGLMIPGGVTQLPITLPTDPEALYPGGVEQQGMVTQKLSDLEASLLMIDDRLDELNFQMRDERITRLEDMLGGTGSPEAQAILIQALQKMEDIDEKLSRLSDLQRGMRSLDTEMRAIKSDIEQQTTIVGEQQREINHSLATARMQQDTPPKIVVQATIPGRAWLRSETGELLTVIPGDDIPGYGRVISIDAATGTVVMSSRAVFRES